MLPLTCTTLIGPLARLCNFWRRKNLRVRALRRRHFFSTSPLHSTTGRHHGPIAFHWNRIRVLLEKGLSLKDSMFYHHAQTFCGVIKTPVLRTIKRLHCGWMTVWGR